MSVVDNNKNQEHDAEAAAVHPKTKTPRTRQSDLGPELLPDMEHFVWLARKVKRPSLIHALIVRASGETLPEIAALVERVSSPLPPASRKVLFHTIAKMPGSVRQRFESAAERVELLDDEYGMQAVQSLLDYANADDAAMLAAPTDKHSRALYLYLRQEHPAEGQKIDRRFDQAEHVQVMHRQWKSEHFSSHYAGPKGVVPTFDANTEATLRERVIGLYPKATKDDIIIEHFTRRDLAHADRCADAETDETAAVATELHTVTVTFNGSEAHYKKVENGEVVCHDDDAALSVSYSWDTKGGALGVFSEDRDNRRELAMIFRDVVLACDGEINDMPMREFDLLGFSTPAMLKRIEDERVEGIEKISILQVKIARPFEQHTIDEANGHDIVQSLSSTLTVTRDRRDARNIYQVAYDDYGLDDLTGYALSQVKLVFRMAKQAHRRAHNVAVQITAPNGLNDNSKTEDDRKRVMAQLVRLGVLCEF